MSRVRYAENSNESHEVIFFIYYKGLKLPKDLEQLEIKKIIEKALEEYEPVE